MAEFNYDRYAVALAFHATNRDDLHPSEQDLIDFDRVLFNSYEDEINTQAGDFGIPPTLRNRSLLVVLAVSSNGDEAGQVQAACRFFRDVSPRLPLDAAAAPAQAAAAPVRRSKSAAGTGVARKTKRRGGVRARPKRARKNK